MHYFKEHLSRRYSVYHFSRSLVTMIFLRLLERAKLFVYRKWHHVVQ